MVLCTPSTNDSSTGNAFTHWAMREKVGSATVIDVAPG
jgi:hypothetical protein